MSSVYISRQGRPPIQIAQSVRNGKAPSAELQNNLAALVGFNARFRTKQVFSRSVPVSAIPSSTASTRVRWRFAWHSGPYAKDLVVWMQLAPQNNGVTSEPYGLLEVGPIEGDGAEGDPIGQATVAWGATGETDVDYPANFGGGMVTLVDPADGVTPVTLTPGTNYYARVSDVSYARIFSIACWEASLDPDTDNGYPFVGTGANSPIHDEDRRDPALMMRKLWTTGAQQLWNWTAETADTAPGEPSLTNSTSWVPTATTSGSTATVSTEITPFGSSQTSLSMEVRIGDVGIGTGSKPAATPVTVTLGSWTQTAAWADAGTYWTATFTIASRTVGEAAPLAVSQTVVAPCAVRTSVTSTQVTVASVATAVVTILAS